MSRRSRRRTSWTFQMPGAETMTQVRLCRFAASAITALLIFAPFPVAAQDKIIKIGALLPMSGPGSYFGAQDRQGIELALDEIKSGVAGVKVDAGEESCAER